MSTTTKTRVVDMAEFIGRQQMRILRQLCRGEEGEWFKDRLDAIRAICATMPATYETNGQGDAAVIHLHYFGPSYDVWIVERDESAEQIQAFGIIDLYRDGGEMGYVCIREILDAGAELDLHWKPITVGELKAKREGGAK